LINSTMSFRLLDGLSHYRGRTEVRSDDEFVG
jgi:hypothetical protein